MWSEIGRWPTVILNSAVGQQESDIACRKDTGKPKRVRKWS